MYQQHSKSMWIGIGLIVAGFFITFWQNIYGISSGFRGIPILALFLLPISIIGVGFGIVAHYFWKQYKEYSKTFKKKKGFEA